MRGKSTQRHLRKHRHKDIECIPRKTNNEKISRWSFWTSGKALFSHCKHNSGSFIEPFWMTTWCFPAIVDVFYFITPSLVFTYECTKKKKKTLFQWVMEIEKPLTIEMLGQDQCQGRTHPPCQRMKSTPHLYFSTSLSQYPCGWVWNQCSLWNLAFRPEATPSRGSTQARRGKALVPGNKILKWNKLGWLLL